MTADPSADSQLDFLFSARPEMTERQRFAPFVWKVRDLVSEIRGRVERDYRDVRVEGEISNLRQAASGHVYFTLKDDRSQLPVVLFRGKARLLKFTLTDGLEIQVRGAVSVYEDRGQLQLVAESVEPRGKGSLQIAFEQLHALLKEEGLFDAARKRPLPPYPRMIGIITSSTGAVIHDMLNVLSRRHARLQVLLYPVAVQGEGSSSEIVHALAWFRENPVADLIVVARGGGSLEDLAAFNSEGVARAIAASLIPVVSAVGHETDFTIADFVSDLRAPTPSAAAELITDAQYRIEEYLEMLAARLERAARYQRMQARERLHRLDATAVFARMQNALGRRQQRVDELRFRLESAWDRLCTFASQNFQIQYARLTRQDIGRKLALQSERLRGLDTALAQAINLPTTRLRARWSGSHERLLALSPLAVLERGYALVYDSNDRLVKNSAQLHKEDRVRMRFSRGDAEARVIETNKDSTQEL